MNIPKLREFKPVEFVTKITYSDNKYGCKCIVSEGLTLSETNGGDLDYYELDTPPFSGWNAYEDLFAKDYPVYIAANAPIKEYFNGKVVFEGTYADICANDDLKKKYGLGGVMTNEILLRNIKQIEKEFWQQEMENRENQMEEREE